jgi:hypothetical protein
LNPGRRGGKPVTSRLSYGTACHSKLVIFSLAIHKAEVHTASTFIDVSHRWIGCKILRKIYNFYFKYFSVWWTFDDMRVPERVLRDICNGISYATLGLYPKRTDINAKETHKTQRTHLKNMCRTISK